MPLRKKNRSLTIAIIVTLITAAVFLFLFLFLGINHRKDVYNDAKVLATEISRKASIEMEVYLSQAILIARSLEKQALLVKKLNGHRKNIHQILTNALEENSNFLGVWTLWEPNAFDGKDIFHTNDTLCCKEGLLGIGYFRISNQIFYELMTPNDFKEQYYADPKKHKKEVLTKPYLFAYSGHKLGFFGTTISIPIMENNEFLGAIGIDFDLGNLQQIHNKIKPYETGYLSLISNEGTIITHSDTNLIRKNIFTFLSSTDTASYNAIRTGREISLETISSFTGEEVFRLFYPINVGKTGKPWSMMVEIPIENATKRSKELLMIAIGILAIGLALLTYLIINIAGRKKYEKEILEAKLKAEESDRLKTAFLNNISHEIRTPLNGILGFAELLVNSKTDDQQAKSYKDIIFSSSQQLLSTISNVIELSKLQAREEKPVIREFEIEKAIRKILDTYSPIMGEKQLQLEIKFPEASTENTIHSDKDKFKQILSCLVSNAIKFTDKGFVEVGYTFEPDNYTFYVKDSGIGIKPENANNIFNFFNHTSPSRTRNYGGLGVGLSISKSLTDLLGGKIWFESEPGNGSTFYFNLPSAKL